MTLQEIKNLQEWYILKWDNKYGPFSYLEVIKMLQGKSIFEFDYIWRTGQDNWKRIAEMAEFSPDRVKELYKKSDDKDVKSIFFRRRHERTAFNGSIVVHDNEKVWKGEAIEVSEGGAGIFMHNALIKPGDKIFLHVKPGDNVPPFNAICEVVNKKFAKVNDREAPVKYGVKFLKIQTQHLDTIKTHVKKKAA